MSAVLEPLDFVLPKREPVAPVLDLSVELRSSSVTEAQAPTPLEPQKPPGKAAPGPGVDPTLVVRQPREEELSYSSAQTRTHDVPQNNPGDTPLTGAGVQDEPLQPLPLD